MGYASGWKPPYMFTKPSVVFLSNVTKHITMSTNHEVSTYCQKYIGNKINFQSNGKASFPDILLKYQTSVKRINYYLGKVFMLSES